MAYSHPSQVIAKKDRKLEEIEAMLTEDINPTIEKLQKDRVQYRQFNNNAANIERLERQHIAHTYYSNNLVRSVGVHRVCVRHGTAEHPRAAVRHARVVRPSTHCACVCVCVMVLMVHWVCRLWKNRALLRPRWRRSWPRHRTGRPQRLRT